MSSSTNQLSHSFYSFQHTCMYVSIYVLPDSSISGRGTVVTGRVEQGTVKTGDDLEVVGIVATQKTICTGDEEDSDVGYDGDYGWTI